MRQRRGPRMLRDFFMFQCNFWGSSARAREFLMKEAPGDFEFIPIEFIYKDGMPTQGGPYYYMNILNRAYTIDPEASDPSIEKTRKLVDGDGFPVKVVFWPGAFLKPAEAWHDRVVWPTFINGFFVSDRLGEALTSSRLSNVILEKIS